MDEHDYLQQAVDVWCPDYPRQTVTANTRQFSASTEEELLDSLKRVNGRGNGFVSVYSFPRGHSHEGETPDVDTIMFDLDVPDARQMEPGDVDQWRRDASDLLARVRMVARYLCRDGFDRHFRASLSGMKGVHLYLDFPTLEPGIGGQMQFKNGLGEYSDGLIAHLEDELNVTLADWVDVDSSDLGRLTRVPNTIHPKATEFFGEERYCVPVSVQELADITPERYQELTSAPRGVPELCHRNPSENTSSVLRNYIRESSGHRHSSSVPSEITGSVKDYESEANQKIELEDIPFLVSHKPCISAYRDRDDQFDYQYASHKFELFVIDELVHKNVPIEVIVDFFRDVPGFTEHETRERISTVIRYNWKNRFSCQKIWDEAPMFCLGDSCRIYQDADNPPAVN